MIVIRKSVKSAGAVARREECMTYCISDIHGEYDLFRALLRKIRLTDGDRLILLGNVIDRGTPSLCLLDFAMNRPNTYMILGEHEWEFLRYCRGEEERGALDADAFWERMREYFPFDGDRLTRAHIDFLEHLPAYLVFRDFLCVHAGVPLDAEGHLIPLTEAMTEELVCDTRFAEPDTFVSDPRCIVFGHTPVPSLFGRPAAVLYRRPGAPADSADIRDYARAHIDSGAFFTGVLCAFCVETCRVTYADRSEVTDCD